MKKKRVARQGDEGECDENNNNNNSNNDSPCRYTHTERPSPRGQLFGQANRTQGTHYHETRQKEKAIMGWPNPQTATFESTHSHTRLVEQYGCSCTRENPKTVRKKKRKREKEMETKILEQNKTKERREGSRKRCA